MSIRTDLAVESARQMSLTQDIEGIDRQISIDEESQFEITDITINTDEAAHVIGKPKGRYITLKALDGSLDKFSPHFDKRAGIIAQQIKKLGENAGSVLVAGLGNRAITPDAIGPLCAEKIFATRHIKMYANEIDSSDLTELSVIETGVLGQTGVEASEQVKAVTDRISPEIVVAVDALACSEPEHIGCTVQLCNTGISPGSGVENARKELSRATLGVTCIAVGVPTVIDLSTAAEKMFGQTAPRGTKGLTVTPRDVDKLVKNAAEYIALGINLAFQPSLSAEDLRILTD